MRTSPLIAAGALGAFIFTSNGPLRILLAIIFIAAVAKACEPKRH